MSAADKILLRALAGEKTDHPPVWLMRQAGRYLPEYRKLREQAENFLAFCYSPDLAVEATLQPIRRYGFDAAIMFCDILVIPDALGQDVRFVAGEGPKLDPVRDIEGLSFLSPDNVVDYLNPVFETIGRLREQLPDDVALIGFAGSPWTVATYMVEGGSSRDYENVRGWAYRAPDEFKRLIDLVTEVTADYLIKQADSGVEAVQLFDSWAGVLPPDQFRAWSIAPTAEIVRRVKAVHPDLPIIGFPRAAGGKYLDYVETTGVDAVSLDVSVPLAWAAENLQPKCTLQGNLDNLLLVEGGPAMADRVAIILEAFGDGPFIFNLGHGVLPSTPPENVAELCDLVRGRGA